MIVPFLTDTDRVREASRIADHLELGGLIAYPTETVYGLGSALIPDALERLAELKGRAGDQPFLLLVTGPEQVPGLVWTDAAQRLAEAFWPGPLTLALRAEPGRYPDRVVGPGGTVAIRSSPHPGVRAIVSVLGAPITSTSANRAGEPPATRIEDVLAAVRAIGEPEDLWILDGGTLAESLPSTIVDCSGQRPRVLRAGAISIASLRTIIDDLDG